MKTDLEIMRIRLKAFRELCNGSNTHLSAVVIKGGIGEKAELVFNEIPHLRVGGDNA